MNQQIIRESSRFIRWTVVIFLLIILFLGLVGFVLKWAWLVYRPQMVFAEFYPVVDDLFSLLLMYEMLDLLRTLSPNRLLDLLLTIMARKILLSRQDSSLILETVVFSILLGLRVLWSRFSRPKSQALVSDGEEEAPKREDGAD